VKLPGGGRLGFKVFLKRLYEEYENDGVADSAAALSYYFLFSLFPFLFFLATLIAYLPLVRSSTVTMMDRVRVFLPGDAAHIIDEHLGALIARPRPHLLTIGLLIALYSASRGVDAVRKALNLAYDVKESRPWWRTELLAFGATIGGAALLMVAVLVLVAGGSGGYWIAQHLGIADSYVLVWRWLRWPVTAAVIMSCAASAYYFLPDVKQEFKFITPGSVIGTASWLAATLGFSTYVSHFGNYNITYGSIGGVIILLTWFYITGFIFLMGGEINAILEHASVEGKESGARAEGEAPPPRRERPSAMPVGAAASVGAAERSPGGVTP